MHSRFASRNRLAGLLLGLCALCALAQEAAPALRGTWTATAGSQTFRGSWGAQISLHSPDAAQGYWTLLNDSDERVLQGSWSARKTGARWHGTWTARTSRGQSFSGVWDAGITDPKIKTFAGLLIETLAKEVAGSWQSGRLVGNWWLQGAQPTKPVR